MAEMKTLQAGLYHGGDYNPDQWLDDYPEIIERDFEIMRETHSNTFSINIFGWAKLEPKEGRFDFAWLDDIVERMARHDYQVILATPSAAKPAWMAQRYPETCKVDERLQRKHFGGRHNFCWTSPLYRQKVQAINRLLAERYGRHPNIILWHLSNEYGGDALHACYCELCQEKFRHWLQQRYQSIEKLNQAWWSHFWAHTFSDWSEIEAPHELNNARINLHGLVLDWKRFTSDNALDFMQAEIAAIREFSPDIPVTTNFMGTFEPLDYWKFARSLDLASLDSYPRWHTQRDANQKLSDIEMSHWQAFHHDQMRCFKQKSWLLMESVPSAVQWAPYAKNKRPGMHKLSSMQAVAHGADGILYFQFRKGRGGSEKFHGAIVDHVGHVQTRVGRDVAELGALLRQLGAVRGGLPQVEAAVIYDWPNRWAYENSMGPRNDGKVAYVKECVRFYQTLRNRQIGVDVIDTQHDFSSYRLLIAPLLYMLSEATAAKLREFVQSGGTLLTTYWSGIVDQNDLCHMGGWPGLLRDVFGIWNEEIDALGAEETRGIEVNSTELQFSGSYQASLLWESLHLEGAECLAKFSEELFAGQPALTRNQFGKGQAYYLAAHAEQRLLQDLLDRIVATVGVKAAVTEVLPPGVFANTRKTESEEFVFWQNFSAEEQKFSLDKAQCLVPEQNVVSELHLPPYGIAVTRKNWS